MDTATAFVRGEANRGHFHLELIMPPTKDVEEAVETVLAPFSEHLEAEDRRPKFFDWYIIGGRWDGIVSQSNVTKFSEMKPETTCYRVIIAALQIPHPRQLKATFMVSGHVWNGVNLVETRWDCTIGHALALAAVDRRRFSDRWAEAATPKPDWLAVTIDYHV